MAPHRSIALALLLLCNVSSVLANPVRVSPDASITSLDSTGCDVKMTVTTELKQPELVVFASQTRNDPGITRERFFVGSQKPTELGAPQHQVGTLSQDRLSNTEQVSYGSPLYGSATPVEVKHYTVSYKVPSGGVWYFQVLRTHPKKGIVASVKSSVQELVQGPEQKQAELLAMPPSELTIASSIRSIYISGCGDDSKLPILGDVERESAIDALVYLGGQANLIVNSNGPIDGVCDFDLWYVLRSRRHDLRRSENQSLENVAPPASAMFISTPRTSNLGISGNYATLSAFPEGEEFDPKSKTSIKVPSSLLKLAKERKSLDEVPFLRQRLEGVLTKNLPFPADELYIFDTQVKLKVGEKLYVTAAAGDINSSGTPDGTWPVGRWESLQCWGNPS